MYRFEPPSGTIANSIAVLAGILSHVLHWSRYEFDAHVWRITLGYLAFLALCCASAGSFTAVGQALILELAFTVGVFANIGVYRFFFHPLRNFPGPKWARLSQWWKVKNIVQRGPHYRLIDSLHEQYGDVVRIGPNHLSIKNVEALTALYGSHSECTKPPSYLVGGIVSVQSERDPHRHRIRRGVWDKALGAQACNSFLPTLLNNVDLLIQRIEEHNARPMEANDWMHYITFDLMANMVFSRDWGQLKNSRMNEGVEFATKYLKYAIFGTQIPWLALAATQIPGLPEPQSQMMEFSIKALDERASHEPEVPDAMSYLLKNKDPEAQRFLTPYDLQSDSFMIIIAGADTSFSVLINMLVYLASQPTQQAALRTEVQSISPNKSTISWPHLSTAPLLDAMIRETLRMHPPVPSGLGRLTPSNGLSIPNTDLTLPGNAIVSVPTYSLHRSSQYFVNPNTWLPARWLDRPELILDKRAFCPFSLGTYGCAGKYFAYMEMKVVLARIVLAFDVKLADEAMKTEEGLRKWFEKQDDWMTLQPGQVRLRFEKVEETSQES